MVWVHVRDLEYSTSHLIFEEHIFEKFYVITDEETDKLNLDRGMTDTSRTGCQICLTMSMNSLNLWAPEAVADARSFFAVGKNP